MSLEPLPAPGAGVFPQFIGNARQSISIQGKPFSKTWNVTNSVSGQDFITVDHERMSASHRKHLIDPSSGQELCEIRKENFSSHSRYYATGGNGSTLFETETHFHFSGNETTLKFINNAAGGQQDTLEFKNQPFSSTGEVTYRGKVCATIHKVRMSMSGLYDLEIAPGLDPFLILALVVALDDKQRSQNSGAAAGAASAGGAGA